jgi:protein-L-isoaspartate(D-aspartate) O-methyltransferase
VLHPRTMHMDYEQAKKIMISSQLKKRGIEDRMVLAAMATVPRESFVQQKYEDRAYEDTPLPVGCDQTISQPYIVALMTESLRLQGDEKVLEVGTGSGYQTAVLCHVAEKVYTVEIKETLHRRARRTIKKLGYENVEFRHGDGYSGWEEQSPFEAIIVTAAPPSIPEPLLAQLGIGGRMVIPIGDAGGVQQLLLIERGGETYKTRNILPVRFVPMTGRAQRSG